WATGLTTILGIAFDGRDRLYVLESLTNPGFPGPGQLNSGKVVRIDPSGAKTVIATGLNSPGGMTLGPDGALYVTNFSFGAPLGAGQVVEIDIPTKGGGNRLLSEATSESAPEVNSAPAATQQQSSVFLSLSIQQSGEETATADSDVALQEVASKRLSGDSELSSVTVTITGARAVLTGTVTSVAAKAKAAKLIRALPGVKSVDNKIQVSGG